MRTTLMTLTIGLFFLILGCRSSSYPKINEPGVSNVTYVGAFSNYGKVYRTTYAVLNRYAVIKYAHYSRGTIVAEFLTNREYLDKTRTVIYAHIKKRGKFLFDPKFYDVEIRVAKQMDTSEVNPLSKEVPPYRWRTFHFDQQLENKLLNEIKLALTRGGFYQKKNIYASGEEKEKPKELKTSKKKNGKTAPTSQNASSKERKNLQKVSSPKSPKPDQDTFVFHKREDKKAFQNYVILGATYANKGEWNMASLYFRSAILNLPNYQPAYYFLTTSYIGEEKYDLALETLAKGLGMKDHADPLYIAELFGKESRFIEIHRKLVGSPEKELLKAFLLLGINKKKEAKDTLAKIQSSYLKEMKQKLMELANQKDSSLRKYY